MARRLHWLLAAIGVLIMMAIFVAYGRLSSPMREQFWMEAAKSLLQLFSITFAGGIIAWLLKGATDYIQSRQQAEAAKDQFRKDLIRGFVDARYKATGRRDRFLSAPPEKREELYQSMMAEDLITIKEDLSRVWHDVETGQQSLTNAEEVKENVIKMKEFLDDMIAEHRHARSIPSTVNDFENLPFFSDFLKEGPAFRSFLKRYRTTLALIRNDLFHGGAERRQLAQVPNSNRPLWR